MKQKKLIVLLLIISLFALPLIFIQSKQNLSQKEYFKAHILGGFSVDTSARVSNAAKDGVQVAFEYGQPPSENNILGQKLQSSNMKVIDGYIADYLHYYECHRTALLKPSLMGPGQYCQNDQYPNLTDVNVLLATIAAHLKQVKNNQLVIGYWVLDDWVQWDAGNARPILIKIHQLIQQYTPGRPTICGFGGSIGLDERYGWDDWIADNFSPQGCDKVGFYIYTSSYPDTIPASPSSAYNWSMAGILPVMFTSLQKRGWNISKEPLIGIAQAFGGPIVHTNNYWVTPTAQDIETQSRSFCEHGATGLTFYAWDDSGFGPTTQTPMNDPQIETGIRDGIQACKQYWSSHSLNTPRSSQTVIWNSLFADDERKRSFIRGYSSFR